MDIFAASYLFITCYYNIITITIIIITIIIHW